ncbi:hypothetical protein LJC09_03090 [Desulfovibrio sp. OttesenSCG-928-F20]|nr:hypothetical protein [Desulfovibrio sp. OttesenSCG-928-F20]
MRSILFGMLLSLVVILPAFAADSGAELNLENDQVFVIQGGKSTALDQDMFPAQPIDETDLRFLGIGLEDAKEHGVAPGLYIFKSKGKPFAFVPTDEADFCSDVKLSPNGKILAMDSGMSLVRNWFFYSFPEMKAIGNTVYYQTPDNPAIIWVKDTGVLVSTMNEDSHGRTCEYDPCGSVSVAYYDFATNKASTLLVGTELCDYTLTGLDDDGQSAIAAELCLPSIDAWKTFPEEQPVREVKVKLP